MSFFLTLRHEDGTLVAVEVTRMIRTNTGKIIAIEGIDANGVSHSITPENTVFSEEKQSA